MEELKFKERCKIHKEKKVKFVKINNSTQKQKSQPLFTCQQCMTSGDFNLSDYFAIKDIINENKIILQNWPCINNQELMKKLIETESIESSNSKDIIIEKIMLYYKNLKALVLEQIDMSQNKMIQIAQELPYYFKTEQLIQEYQQISKLDQLRDQLLNNNIRMDEKETICSFLIERSQSQNTIQTLESLLNAYQRQLIFNPQPSQNIIQNILYNINNIQLFPDNNNIPLQFVQYNINESILQNNQNIPSFQQNNLIPFGLTQNINNNYNNHQSIFNNSQNIQQLPENNIIPQQFIQFQGNNQFIFNNDQSIPLFQQNNLIPFELSQYNNNIYNSSINHNTSINQNTSITNNTLITGNADIVDNTPSTDNISELQLIHTNFRDGKNYLEISTNIKEQQQVKVINEEYPVQVVSNMIFQHNKKYILRLKIDNIKLFGTLEIGLIQDNSIHKSFGTQDNMCCHLTRNGQLIESYQSLSQGIDKQLKGEGLVLSDNNEIELRISIDEQILHIVDYPNYHYKLGLLDKYIDNLINGNDLRLFIGLRYLNTTVTITHASIVSSFDWYVKLRRHYIH